MFFVLGSIVALGAALAFVVIVLSSAWGTFQAIRDEVLRGFVRENPPFADRATTLLFVSVPLLGVLTLGLLSVARLFLVALGMG